MNRAAFFSLISLLLILLLVPGSAGATGNLTLPTSGTITQTFFSTVNPDVSGNYYDQNDQLKKINKKFHSGVDFSSGTAECTTNTSPVYAAAGGTVLFAGYDTSGFGWSVRIGHGLAASSNGKYLFTLYAYMGTADTKGKRGTSCLQVSQGDIVTAGQLIGYQGKSGRSTGIHLHWAIKANSSTDSWKGSYWASPDFYTCLPLTAGDQSPLGSATAGHSGCNMPQDFSDDFSSYPLGSTPSGWTQYGTTAITPTVVEYGGTGASFQRLRFPAYTAESTSKFLIRDDQVGTNITATVKLNFQTSNDGGGLIVAWQDTGNYIAILPNPFWDEIVVWEFANGQLRSATNPGGRFSIPINTNQDYWLRVVTSQDQTGAKQLEVYWSTDGQNFTQQSTATHLANLTGGFGVGTYQFLTETLLLVGLISYKQTNKEGKSEGEVPKQVVIPSMPPGTSANNSPGLLENQSWKTYTSKKYGYTIKYPENAQLIEGEREDFKVFIEGKEYPVGAYVAVDILQNPKRLSLPELGNERFAIDAPNLITSIGNKQPSWLKMLLQHNICPR
jgi:murein DD-endopeptidase MepM/ murein hydrolase activator NlpD